MHDPHDFLQALTVVLCVAGITTFLFHRLKQPVVLGYIVAGVLVSPRIPTPLAADKDVVAIISELGVILLMFALGLEFSVRKLIKVGPTAGVTAVIQSSFMIWLGYLVGQAFGWSTRECLFTGAIIAISSTTIIAKAFDEQGIKGRLRELVVGVLIVEDLIAILLMALLTAMSSGEGLSASTMARSAGELLVFLVTLMAVGMLLVPRIIRATMKLQSPETTVVVNIGICFAVALLAHTFGYSVALGAFLAGSLVAESGEERPIEKYIHPIRDMFAAIFFVSVGMLIDPALIVDHWRAVAVLTLVVIFGKLLGVSFGAFLAGNGTRTSIQSGMSLAQIGEFSFIIAALGLTLGATGEFLYPVAVAVSAITTLTTPWLIRISGPTASFVDRKLPRPLQTFAALYGSWLEQLHRSPRAPTRRAAVRRLTRLFVLDAGLLAAIVIGAALLTDETAVLVSNRVGLAPNVARVIVMAGAALLAIPFGIGIFRIARSLGLILAEAALPATADGTLDLAAAPRRALVVTLQLALVLAAAVPLVAITQPFLPRLVVALGLLLLVIAFGIAFWRSAESLHGHVRAGAQIMIEALAVQSKSGIAGKRAALDDVRELLPGIGAPIPVLLDPASCAVGKTLAELDVRGLTGATVLAIIREDAGVTVPTAREQLRAGDILALAGTQESIDAAVVLMGATKTEGTALSESLPSPSAPPG